MGAPRSALQQCPRENRENEKAETHHKLNEENLVVVQSIHMHGGPTRRPTNKRKFGSLYNLYCDVGKPIESLAVDNDNHHHDIVPNLHYSADCVIYFHTDSDDHVKKIEQKYKKYIDDNKEYIKTKGYDLDSNKLTTGRIEIARLDSKMSEKELLTNLKYFDKIQSLILI